MGTKAVPGNLKLYGVQKQSGKFIVRIIKERIKELERRKAKTEDYLEIMRQVVSNVIKTKTYSQRRVGSVIPDV